MKTYKVKLNSKDYEVELLKKDLNSIVYSHAGIVYEVSLQPILSLSDRTDSQSSNKISDGQVCAPMPGIVVDVLVKPGDQVAADQTLCVIEAMKMENNILAPGSGKVLAVHIKATQEVDSKQLLFEIDPLPS